VLVSEHEVQSGLDDEVEVRFGESNPEAQLGAYI
jgi:hypothetical protein